MVISYMTNLYFFNKYKFVILRSELFCLLLVFVVLKFRVDGIMHSLL